MQYQIIHAPFDVLLLLRITSSFVGSFVALARCCDVMDDRQTNHCRHSRWFNSRPPLIIPRESSSGRLPLCTAVQPRWVKARLVCALLRTALLLGLYVYCAHNLVLKQWWQLFFITHRWLFILIILCPFIRPGHIYKDPMWFQRSVACSDIRDVQKPMYAAYI